MRKADYAALAQVIRDEIRLAAQASLHAPDPVKAEQAARADAAQQIARGFAMLASVNRDEFLKACGITP